MAVYLPARGEMEQVRDGRRGEDILGFSHHLRRAREQGERLLQDVWKCGESSQRREGRDCRLAVIMDDRVVVALLSVYVDVVPIAKVSRHDISRISLEREAYPYHVRQCTYF